MKKTMRSVCIAVALLGMIGSGAVLNAADTSARPLKVLFLGDNGLHRPAERAAQLVPVLERRGIEIQYTDDPHALSSETLRQFAGLIVYANIITLTPQQETALLDYVASGHGLIALHCATACFVNSDAFIALVGAQFKTHGADVFRTEVAATAHPILDGYGGFSSWDETYVHHRHNEDRTVLEYRRGGMQAAGADREPWTWVRTHGKGRVFYTAWGHDHRTWGHPGFHNLVERGIRWACGGDPTAAGDFSERRPLQTPEMTAPNTDVKPFEYVEVGAKIPHYIPGGRGKVDAITTMQKPLPAEESIKHYVTPVGFEMRLFVDETQLGGKPIAMTWDERGRLWVCETYDYPNDLQPPGEGRDRIRICEDTDADGRADRFVIFADKLSIPTSIAFYRGGAVVQDGTRTLYLKDTDGDDRADIRETLLTGWFLGDTHGGVSNFQYGHDNWLWAMQGYNLSTPTAADRQFQSFRMGFFRFKLEGSDPPHVADLEFVRSTNNNTWGLGFSEEGIVFGSTANMNPSIYMPIPNRYYERVSGWAPELLSSMADTHLFQPITDKIRQVDVHGGYTAGAGHAIYTARRYPQEWWNRTAFVCGPTGHLVGTFVLRAEGADFRSSNPFNLAASDDEWAAPIMAEVGPDGNVWIIDWYNYIVQHNPTPPGFETGKGNAYISDLRDKKHGRIYRVVYDADSSGDALRDIPNLRDASPQALVATLRHATMLWRKHAQRLLVERGKSDVIPALIELVNDSSVDEIGLNVGAIHALWTMEGLGALDGSDEGALRAAVAALEHPSAGVRRNAVQVLPPTEATAAALLDADILHDVDAQVRLAGLLALADAPPGDRIAEALAGVAADVTTMSDRWLPDALTSAAAMNAMGFLEVIARNKIVPPRLRDDKREPLIKTVAFHLARSGLRSGEVERLTEILATAPGEVAEQMLAGLSDGWPTDGDAMLTAAAEMRLQELIDRLPVASQGHVVRLANLLGSDKFRAHADRITTALMETISNEDLGLKERLAAAAQLVQFQPHDDAVVGRLLDLVTPQTPPELAEGLIGVLPASTAPGVSDELVKRIGGMTPDARAATIRVLLSRPQSTMALLEAIERQELQIADLTLDQRQALDNHPERPIRMLARELLNRAGGLPNPDREKVIASIAHVAERSGDAAAGREVFKKQCAACHTHSGEGTRIGPDLTGMAVHPKHELLTQILDPSRSVEANFRLYTVVTGDGRILSGMLAGETRTTIELVDTKGERHTLQRANIEELVSSTKSLMPEGFEKQMSETELADLLAFLTQRGKYLPLPLDKAATTVSTRGMFINRQAKYEQLVFADWSPKEVDGVPFVLIDPQGGRVPNVILLHSSFGEFTPQMPKSVTIPCNSPAVALHFLGGVSGLGYPRSEAGTVSMIVRLHYADGGVESHELKNGVHLADFMQRAEVPESKFAFQVGGNQVRSLTIRPRRDDIIAQIELLKGPDNTAPIVVAVTAETK